MSPFRALLKVFYMLFIWGRAGSPLLCGLSLVAPRGLLFVCAQASHCGASLAERGSRLSSCSRAACVLSSCGPRAQLFRGIWNRPRSDQTCIPCIGRQILTHCTTRDILLQVFKDNPSSLRLKYYSTLSCPY